MAIETLETRAMLSATSGALAASASSEAEIGYLPAETVATPLSEVIVDQVSPLILSVPGQTYQLQSSLRFSGTGVYIAAPNVTLDLNGHTIYYGGGNTNTTNDASLAAHGVVLYRAHWDTEIAIPEATSPIDAVIKGGSIIHEGTGAVSHAIYGYDGGDAYIHDVRAEAYGTDSHAVYLYWGKTKLENNVLVSHAADSFDRHAGPGTVRGDEVEALSNIVIGGNSGIIAGSNSVITGNLISQNSVVTNGYGVWLYDTQDVVVRDNLILPANGRGVLLNGGINIDVSDNVILHLDAPNAEFGSDLNAAAVRSRYDTSGNTITGNIALGIGGADAGLTSASGFYLTESGNGEPSRYENNDLTTILAGERDYSHYAQPITFEQHGYAQQSKDVISGNTFRSNDSLVRVQGWDGSLQSAVPIVGNTLEWIDGSSAAARFIAAITTKLDELQMGANPIALQVVGDAVARIQSLILGVPLNSERGTWFLKDGWGPVKVDGTFLDNQVGTGVAIDSYSYFLLSGGEVSVKIGQTVPVVLLGNAGALASASVLVSTDLSDSYDEATSTLGGLNLPVIEFAFEKAEPADSPIVKQARSATTITVAGYQPLTLSNSYLLSHKYDASPLVIQLVPIGGATPLASADTYATNEDLALSVPAAGVLSNDSDPLSRTLSAMLVTGPSHGTIQLNGDGSFVYTPGTNYQGSDSFTYRALAGGDQSAIATVSLLVTPVNDPPSGLNRTISQLEDAAYVFSASDFGFTDALDSPANSLAAVRIATLPAAGTLTNNGAPVTAGQFVSAADIAAGRLRFTPPANANGNAYASFTFQVQDNGGTASGGIDLDPTPNTLTINVTGVNDPPQGTNRTLTIAEDSSYVFAAADFGFSDSSDSPANAFTGVRVSALPNAGQLALGGSAISVGQFVTAGELASGALRFTPAPHANGSNYASFTFQVQDDGGTANGGVDRDPTPNTITLNVTSVNDFPLGLDHRVTTALGVPYAFQVADFGFHDPADSPPHNFLAVRVTTVPVAGSLVNGGSAITAGQFISVADILAGQMRFIPAAGGSGAGYASFTFQVQDDGGQANGGMSLDIVPDTMTIDVTPGIAGLLGLWRFDEGTGETAHDSSGNEHHGLLEAGANYAGGQSGTGLVMSQASKWVRVPGSTSFNVTGAVTLAAWISPNMQGTQTVIARSIVNDTDGFELSLSNSGKVFVRFNQRSSGDSYRVDSVSSFPTDNSWMHVVATYDGAQIRLYINGLLQASKAAAFSIAPNALDLAIGADSTGNRGMRGRIDDALIANRAFSSTEVAALYAGTLLSGTVANAAPVVNAGADLVTQVGLALILGGSVSDDGLPLPPSLTSQWSVVSGPGSVSFGSSASPATTATFSVAGTYILRLTASDGTLNASDDITVQVSPAGTPSLLGFWNFRPGIGGAYPSAIGHLGDVQGGGSVSFDGRLTLTGAGQSYVIPDMPALRISSTITMAAWVKPAASGAQSVIAKTGGSADGYELGLGADGKVFVRFNGQSSGDTLRVASTTSFPTNGGGWIHVAATYDGAAIRLYVNGQLEGSKPASFTIGAGDQPLVFGGGLIGQMDEALLDTHALSAAEIDQLFRGRLQPAEPANRAPTAHAGADTSTQTGTSTLLAGSATDDGNPANRLLYHWVVVGGPGSVAFENASAGQTRATFSTSGSYQLRLWASDEDLMASDDVLITVTPASNPSGVVGYWRFETDTGSIVTDTSGNHNDGTLQADARLGVGHTGAGIVMSQAGQGVVVPHAPSLMLAQQLTIAAWIAPISKGTQVVVSKASMNAIDGYELTLSNSGKVFVRFNQDSAGDTFRVDSVSSYSTTGSWMHVAATYDGAVIRLYVNGVLEASKVASFSVNPNTLALGLGAEASGARGMRGRIDDVLIANRAFSGSEIAALFGGAEPLAVPAAGYASVAGQPFTALATDESDDLGGYQQQIRQAAAQARPFPAVVVRPVGKEYSRLLTVDQVISEWEEEGVLADPSAEIGLLDDLAKMASRH